MHNPGQPARISHTQSTAAADLAASTALPLGRPPQRTQRVRLRGPWGTRLRVTRLVSTAIFTASFYDQV
jgi:hypothetical protein